MGFELDNFTSHQRQEYVLAAVVIGLVLSNLSFALRVWARILIIKNLRAEDWWMLAGLLLSYATAGCMLYGLTTGLGQPVNTLSEPQQRGFLLSLWVTQKFQPPTIFCIKTSIILFNASIFQNRTFRIVSWVVWGQTLVWMIAVEFGTAFQCSPPSYFWDKQQEGTCLPGTLLTIGLTSSVLSCVGDIVIFLMPIPALARLRVDRRTKVGLIGIFTLGLFVVCTSIIRWVAVLGAPRDGFNSNQVEVGIWTYFEMSIGITCGNLPFLAPLFGCVGPRRKSSARTREQQQQQQQPKPPEPAPKRVMGIRGNSEGFTRMYDDEESPTGNGSGGGQEAMESSESGGVVKPLEKAVTRSALSIRKDPEWGRSWID
ncbi:hypothetical protein QBC46DRAFT_424080 [Diplogelasinospora grovesii]|uniref:Rhodopsin domain-containing protein n=1 Tax=Diplogelasinospora grovesii TaxID=303347 RepID=A0AAN6MZJ2_9PEZI|nr:hypothetical protein QBC46DRAFT_424080 [Diplogelasinospora grovesii]